MFKNLKINMNLRNKNNKDLILFDFFIFFLKQKNKSACTTSKC